MKRTLLFLMALVVSAGFAFSQGIIMDFSGVTRGDNGNWQQGWTGVNGIIDKIAQAKYLVIETSGVGNNAGGFGGLDLIVQGAGSAGGVNWGQHGLWGGWVNYTRADGQTVSIAIDLQATLGTDYATFIQCTNWANLLLQYAYGDSTHTAFTGLGLVQAYLTGDFSEPAGSTDFTGGSGVGFIFNGSVKDILGGGGGTTLSNLVLDFESDAVGTAYSVIGYTATDITATVESNPAGTGQSLHVINTNWGASSLFSVTLPAGKTIADIDSISFDLYFQSIDPTPQGQIPNSYKGFDYFFGSKGTSFSPGGKTGNTGNVIAAPANNPGQTWLHKEFVPAVPDSILSLSLNQFDFGFGLQIDKGDYYLDNITFWLKGGTGIIPVYLNASNVCNTEGGIIVNGNNEAVAVYAIDGRLVKQTIANQGTNIALQRGLYIVKVGANKAVKVVVK